MKLLSILAVLLLSLSALEVRAEDTSENNFIDSGEYDPAGDDVSAWLSFYDQIYEEETGESAYIGADNLLNAATPHCVRETCALWAKVVRSEQRLYLYKYGVLINGAGWLTSTGAPGHGTPSMETTINGHIYNKYSSNKFPGGDYNGLGNMPYAVFIDYGRQGFAIHGTPQSNWKYLGSVASHGCVRIHPDNAVVFNQMVKDTVAVTGTKRSVWISVK
jgi:hypothetical protein